MISAFQIWTSVGTLVGTVIDNFTAKIAGRNSYIIPLGIIYVIPAIMAIGLFLIPESPRWLMQKGKADQARKSLRWLRPGTDGEVAGELGEIQAALDADAELQRGVGFWDMFANPIDRRRTILAVCALTVQGRSGAMYIIAFGTYFFEIANIGSAFENSCILVAIGVVAILVNSAVVTHIGRRRVFLFTGLIFCGLAQLFTAVAWTVAPGTAATGKAIVGLAVLYILGYNVRHSFSFRNSATKSRDGS